MLTRRKQMLSYLQPAIHPAIALKTSWQGVSHELLDDCRLLVSSWRCWFAWSESDWLAGS